MLSILFPEYERTAAPHHHQCDIVSTLVWSKGWCCLRANFANSSRSTYTISQISFFPYADTQQFQTDDVVHRTNSAHLGSSRDQNFSGLVPSSWTFLSGLWWYAWLTVLVWLVTKEQWYDLYLRDDAATAVKLDDAMDIELLLLVIGRIPWDEVSQSCSFAEYSTEKFLKYTTNKWNSLTKNVTWYLCW